MSSRRWILSLKGGVESAATEPTPARTRQRSLLLHQLDAWRDAATDVEAAWRRWRAASGCSRADAAHAFFAALDREEKAASAYQLAWES